MSSPAVEVIYYYLITSFAGDEGIRRGILRYVRAYAGGGSWGNNTFIYLITRTPLLPAIALSLIKQGAFTFVGIAPILANIGEFPACDPFGEIICQGRHILTRTQP